MTAAQASGKIKKYQMFVGLLLILNLPVSYAVLKLGGSPESTMVVAVVISLIALFVRLWIISPLVQLSVSTYCREALVPVILTSIPSIAMGYGVRRLVGADDLLRGLLVMLLSFIISATFVYLLGLSQHERQIVRSRICKNK